MGDLSLQGDEQHPANFGKLCVKGATLDRVLATPNRLTRADMRRAGWSPSVRLFEAAACAVPVVSDWWEGLGAFFAPGREILVEETVDRLAVAPEELRAIGERARARVLAEHTAEHRADELEAHMEELAAARAA